jgi:pyridoxine kinase
MKKRQKRILAIHDLSGFGNTSLMSVIPIMYSYGIAVHALPTALLSANTCFAKYKEQDCSAFMEQSLAHWQELGIRFDTIYSGFLGNPHQVGTVINAIDNFGSTCNTVVVDPVLADDGVLYQCYSQDMVKEMRKLVKTANIITPNYTEACFLADMPYKLIPSAQMIEQLCQTLSEMGPSYVIITSVPDGSGQSSSVILYEGSQKTMEIFNCKYLPYFYPGTGDIFTSVLVAELVNGVSISTAIGSAIRFVRDAILLSQEFEHDAREGVVLEQVLRSRD